MYKKVIVYGNGESRMGKPLINDMESWGCNAIYRDTEVDNLVSVDYNMQQEIYESGYAHKSKCYFTDWSVIPQADDMLLSTMKMNFKPEMIHETSKTKWSAFGGINRTDCVIQGKEPKVAQSNLKEALDKNPNLDYNDLRLKAEMNVGLYITWVDEKDMVNDIDYPTQWSAGNTALHLACQGGANEIYMLGFDSSDYKEPLNNVYKGSVNYLPETAKGFNPVNWNNQLNTLFNEYNNVKFKWVGSVHKMTGEYLNVEYIAYENLYNSI